MTRTAFAVALTLGSLSGASNSIAESQRLAVERELYLMGTRVRLVVLDEVRGEGLRALDSAVASLEATEAALSTWREDSDISRLNRNPIGTRWMADAQACVMFEEVYRWQRLTAGAFDPAIGALIRAWGIHESVARTPSPEEIAGALARSGLDRLTFDRPTCTLTRAADVAVDVGAFGKGEALDRAASVLANRAWLIDVGGQVSVGPQGDRAWPVDIAHPADRERPLARVHLRHGSLSTSGGSERDQIVDGRRVGHILDPRTGSPASFHGSVTVWHERGLTADILSTALYVIGPDEGLAWAEAHDLSVLYLIPETAGVRMRATRSFARLGLERLDASARVF